MIEVAVCESGGRVTCPPTSPAATPLSVPGKDATGSGAGIDLQLLLIIGILLAAVAALIFLVLWLRARESARDAGRDRGRNQARDHSNTAPVPTAPTSTDLPGILITLADLGTTPAVAAQAELALRTLGIEPINASPGSTFQSGIHNAVGVHSTTDASQNRLIATQVRPGWRRGTSILRPADVTVWTTS